MTQPRRGLHVSSDEELAAVRQPETPRDRREDTELALELAQARSESAVRGKGGPRRERIMQNVERSRAAIERSAILVRHSAQAIAAARRLRGEPDERDE